MAWLEAHQGLLHHPKTAKAARALGIPRTQVVGHLFALWWWALDHADDGDLSAYDVEDLEVAAEWEGDSGTLVAALVGARFGHGHGFVEDNDGRLVIHDWWEYAGKLVGKRRADAERKRASRSGPASDVAQPSADDPVTIPSPSAGRPTDVQRMSPVTVPYRTEQNTTNDKGGTPLPPDGDRPSAFGSIQEPTTDATDEKTPPPDSAPPPAPSASAPFALLAAVCEELGQDVSALGRRETSRQCGYAKQLVESGLDPDNARSMVRWLQGQRWVTEGGGIDLKLLAGQVGKWQLAGRPNAPPSSANGRASPGRIGRDIGLSTEELADMGRTAPALWESA